MAGKPRFMRLASWYDAMFAAGKVVWTGAYSLFCAPQLTNKHNQEKAGEGFQLLDVAGCVANPPDCAVGGSNPIQGKLVNPRSALPPVNTNGRIVDLAKTTGRSFFNYGGYRNAGGDGASCPFPAAAPPAMPLCPTDPNPTQQVGVLHAGGQ